MGEHFVLNPLGKLIDLGTSHKVCTTKRTEDLGDSIRLGDQLPHGTLAGYCAEGRN
jgi:hypothetical protein